MKFITDKIKWTAAMKTCAEELAQKKLGRLVEDPTNMTIRLTRLGPDTLKISLKLNDFRAQNVDSDYYIAISGAFTKLKSIITRHKHIYAYKNPSNRQLSIFDQTTELEEDERIDAISKEKIFNLTPMTLDQALEEYESTDYAFYVYKDTEDNNTISIIYKRLDDTYGLIRCH